MRGNENPATPENDTDPQIERLESLETRLAEFQTQLGESEGTKQWRQEREAELTQLHEALENINQRLANSETNLETAITNLTASMESLTLRLQPGAPESETMEGNNPPNPTRENPAQPENPNSPGPNGNTPNEPTKRKTNFL